MFGSENPYIGFTYIDKSKGPSIKGEDVAGLTPAQFKEMPHARFPSSTMAPLDEGPSGSRTSSDRRREDHFVDLARICVTVARSFLI